MVGSPPPMRGQVDGVCQYPTDGGITPAYAGKSRISTTDFPAAQDHPRLCGEKNYYLKLISNGVGSPPPMRGKVNFI